MELRATFCVLRVFSQDMTCILEDTSSCVYSVSCVSFDFFPKTPKTDVILLIGTRQHVPSCLHPSQASWFVVRGQDFVIDTYHSDNLWASLTPIALEVLGSLE